VNSNKQTVSIVSLTAANLVPLFGAVFLGWNALYIVLLYWAENVIIGFYNILKMAFWKPKQSAGHLTKLFFIPFFTFHYGMFTFVHGVFVMALFSGAFTNHGGFSNGPSFALLCSVLSGDRIFALAALFISHGISFVSNYFVGGEYKRTSIEKLMKAPYGRIVVLHIAIILGGFITQALGQPVGVLVILIIMKIALDIKLHLMQHKKLQE